MKKITFIGAGNMAEALIRGMLSEGVVSPEALCLADPSPERRALFESSFGVRVVESNLEAVDQAEVIFLAVKPQQMEAMLSRLRPLPNRALWVSIAAGIKSETLAGWLGDESVRLIRVMPNTPALVAQGAAALAANANAGADDLALVESLLKPSGLTLRVSEAEMDAVTALSGSGPAYVFLLAEAMTQAGVQLGLAPEQADQLARQTIRGAAELMAQSGEAPETLRARVTSKGGTTAAALACFADGDFTGLVARAMKAAADRSIELSHPA